jgi:hypothetical protein
MRTLLLALLLVATPALAEERLDGGQKHQGFALELSIGGRLVTINSNVNGMNAPISVNALQGGVFFGYKISRVIVGLGFDLSRVAIGSSTSGLPNSDTSFAQTAILFTPGIRVAIVRSSDQRVELFGQFDIGFGTTVNEQSPGNAPSNNNLLIVVYDIGPGVRFWAHPSFAVGALAGLNGDFSFTSRNVAVGPLPGMTTTQKNSTGLTSIFAALQFTGVF